jgi:Flp pilus assembly protein TadD
MLIGVASVAMTFLIARRLVGDKWGLLAAALHAIYPTAVYFDAELLLDPFFTLLIQVAIWQFIRYWENRTITGAFLFGLFIGLAAITRPTALVLLAAAILVILLWKQSRAIRLKTAGIVLVGSFLVILPITIRNLVVAGDPVVIASQSGINLFIGNNANADGLSAVMPPPFGHNWQIEDVSYVAEVKRGRSLRPGEVSNYWSERAYEWMRSHPLDFATLYLKKLYYSISNREISNNRDLDTFFERIPFLHYHPLSFAWLFAFGAVGAWVGFRTDRKLAILTAAILLFIFANALFFVNSRFRLPEIPLLIILSVAAIKWFATSTHQPRTTRIRMGIVTATLFLFSFLPVVSFPKGEASTALASQAIFQYRNGQYRESIATGQKIIATAPTFPEANLNIGAAYFRLGIGDSAKFYFERERSLHPGRAKAYNNLASYYLTNHELDSAFIKLNRALLLRPFDLTANTLLLRISAEVPTMSNDELSSYIAGALAETDSNLVLILEAARITSSRKMFDLSEQLLHLSLRQSPPPVETDDLAFDESYPYTPERLRLLRAQAHYLLGFLFGQTGRFPESISESRNAISLDSDLAEAYVNLVSGYLSTGDLKSADSVLSLAAVRFPHDSRVKLLIQRLHQ